MKKILFFYPKLVVGGAERTLVNIINNLDRDDFEIHICLISLSGEFTKMLNDNVTIHKLNSSRLLFSLFPLIKKIHSIKPDIIFSSLIHPNILSFIAAKLSFFKGKIILRETNNHTAAGRSKNNLSHFLARLSYHGCTSIIALSEGVKSDIIFRYGVDEDKIYRIYNPVSFKKITKQLNDKPLEHENIILDQNSFNIISVGRLEKQKGFDLLIEAFISNLSYIRNQKLYIIGDGSEKKSLKLKIESNNQTKNIFLLGSFHNPFQLISQANLFVLASRWEGFGHVIVEAMACKTPVLSADCPSGPNEIIENNKNGMLFKNESTNDLKSKIRFFYDNKEIAEDFKNNALSSIRRFDEKLITKEYSKVFLNE